MRTIEEVRLARLQQLVKEAGSQAKLKDRLGMKATDSTLSQYLNESKGSKTDKPKAMGSVMARRIERALDKPGGWMDTDPAYDVLQWPFGDRVDVWKVTALSPDWLAEAAGALNEVLRRSAEATSKRTGTV
jgi:hypothetical protein